MLSNSDHSEIRAKVDAALLMDKIKKAKYNWNGGLILSSIQEIVEEFFLNRAKIESK